MKLYLCTFRVDTHHYMGRTEKGAKDFRLVYANDEKEAEAKLEANLGTGLVSHGDDSYWLHDFEAHEAIQ